jgi:hypothetical protein
MCLGVGDRQQSERLRDELFAVIRQWNQPTKIATSVARLIGGEADLIDEDLEAEVVAGKAGHRFPFLWLNITFDPERVRPQMLEGVEQRFLLQQTASAFSASANYFL